MQTDDDIRASAEALGVAYYGEIGPERFDPALIAALPVNWAREHAVLPVRVPAGPCEVVLEPVVPWGRYALPALGWIVSLGLLAFWSRRAFAPIAPSPVSSVAA